MRLRVFKTLEENLKHAAKVMENKATAEMGGLSSSTISLLAERTSIVESDSHLMISSSTAAFMAGSLSGRTTFQGIVVQDAFLLRMHGVGKKGQDCSNSKGTMSRMHSERRAS